MKNSNNTIENRTRELPGCRTVPQTTAPPRAPIITRSFYKLKNRTLKHSELQQADTTLEM